MLELIEPSQRRIVPWKNGGGVASDIVVAERPDGGLDWRVATARIDRDGPFSDYPGVDRVFAIIEGPGVRLDFAGEGPRDVGRDRVTRFAGAPGPFARLMAAPATAFNLMLAHGRFTGDILVLAAGGRLTVPAGIETLVLLALDGPASIDGCAVPVQWAARRDRAAGARVTAQGRAAVALIRSVDASESSVLRPLFREQ
jgi:environmental stress-induced protein Ves